MSRSSVFSLSLFRDVAAFGAVIAQIGGRRTWTALLFLILGSLTEGISILLLVPLLPLYYALVSVAAWMAFYEYFNRRFVWNKTEHGLARQRAPIEPTTSDAAIPRPPAQEAARY